MNADNKKEKCPIAYFVEPVKPVVLNVTNCKVIAKIYKTPDVEKWMGKKIQLFATQVKAFGELVDAVRVRSYVPDESKQKNPSPTKQSEPTQPAPTEPTEPVSICADCNEPITAFGKMTAAQVADHTAGKYGRQLCADCATKAANGIAPAEGEAEQ
jgi:hypothetical protein